MLIGNDLEKLETSNRNLKHFLCLYDKNPREFMKEYTKECSYDLKNKVVVCIEITGYENDKYPLQVIGIYYPNINHIAELSYHGHISFITIKNKDGKIIETLYKDDECYPQSFNEWYEYSSECHCFNEYNNFNKDTVLELINTVIKGYTQDLDIEYKEEDIIILEGL